MRSLGRRRDEELGAFVVCASEHAKLISLFSDSCRARTCPAGSHLHLDLLLLRATLSGRAVFDRRLQRLQTSNFSYNRVSINRSKNE